MIVRTSRESRPQRDSSAFPNASKLLALLVFVLLCSLVIFFCPRPCKTGAAFPRHLCLLRGAAVTVKTGLPLQGQAGCASRVLVLVPPFVAPRSVQAPSSRGGGVPAGHTEEGKKKKKRQRDEMVIYQAYQAR